MVGKAKKDPTEPAVLPFLIVSQLLPIHFIYPSCVCGRGLKRTRIGCGCPAILVSFWWCNYVCFSLCRLRHFLLRYWICSAHFWRGPLQVFQRVIVVSCHPGSRSISPSWICPSNTKSNRCAYHNANWLENCVESIRAELWPSALVPVWFKAWKLSAPAFVCSMKHDYWVGDAFTAWGWSSGDLFDQSENYLSQ